MTSSITIHPNFTKLESQSHYVTIRFKGDIFKEYEKEKLETIEGYQDNFLKLLSLAQDCDPEDFQFLLDFVVDKKPFFESLPAKYNQAANLFSLPRLIHTFFPESSEKFIKNIYYYLRSMPIQLAQEILLQSSQKPVISQDDLSDAKTTEKVLPREEVVRDIVAISKQCVIEGAYFKTQVAENMHAIRRAYISEIERKYREHNLLRAKELTFDPTSVIKNRLNYLSNEYQRLRREFKLKDFKNFKPFFTEEDHCKAQRRLEKRQVSDRVKVEFEKFKKANPSREVFIEVLKQNGADIGREDLLDYLIGPKDKLLHYYGFSIDPRSEQLVHAETGMIFNYRLEDVSIFDLEKKMRAHLINYMKRKSDAELKNQGLKGDAFLEARSRRSIVLPAKRYAKRFITKPISPEVRPVYERFKLYLENWYDDGITTAEVVKELKEYIIKQGEWETLGITHKMIGMNVGKKRDCFRGIIMNRKSIAFKFRVFLEDLKPLQKNEEFQGTYKNLQDFICEYMR